MIAYFHKMDNVLSVGENLHYKSYYFYNIRFLLNLWELAAMLHLGHILVDLVLILDKNLRHTFLLDHFHDNVSKISDPMHFFQFFFKTSVWIVIMPYIIGL